MLGASRGSQRRVSEQLDAHAGDAGFAALPAELRSVSVLLGSQSQLRGTLSDGGTSAHTRRGIVEQLLGSRISPLAVTVVQDVVAERWSAPRDLVDVLELLAAQAAFTVAERDGRLDEVEDELFAVGRAYDAAPDLQLTLTDPALPGERKVALLTDLLGSRVQPETIDAVGHLVAHPRGRRLEAALEELVELAAVRKQSLVAVATVARPLEASQRERLEAVLGRIYGRGVNLQETIDPDVRGGVRVQVAGEVIDGTVAHRLEQARRVVS